MILQLVSLSILFCYHSLAFSAAAPADPKSATQMIFHAQEAADLPDYCWPGGQAIMELFYTINPSKPYSTLAIHWSHYARFSYPAKPEAYFAFRIFNEPQRNKICCFPCKTFVKQLSERKAAQKFLAAQKSKSIEMPLVHHKDGKNDFGRPANTYTHSSISGTDSDGVSVNVDLYFNSSNENSIFRGKEINRKGHLNLTTGQAKRSFEHLLLTHKATTQPIPS